MSNYERVISYGYNKSAIIRRISDVKGTLVSNIKDYSFVRCMRADKYAFVTDMRYLYNFYTSDMIKTSNELAKLLHDNTTAESFHKVKEQFNKSYSPAMFAYLCNNSYYGRPRFNMNGGFNASFGGIKDPILQVDRIRTFETDVEVSFCFIEKIAKFYDSSCTFILDAKELSDREHRWLVESIRGRNAFIIIDPMMLHHYIGCDSFEYTHELSLVTVKKGT